MRDIRWVKRQYFPEVKPGGITHDLLLVIDLSYTGLMLTKETIVDIKEFPVVKDTIEKELAVMGLTISEIDQAMRLLKCES